MSGAVAAHAAYNGSGTQGLAVTNKIHDNDGDVMSVFWNKNDTTRQLLYGSSIVEIPSSGSSTLDYNSSRLFTVNNDIDCLGDIYLQIGEVAAAVYTISNQNTTNVTLVTSIDTSDPANTDSNMISVISRIEVQVGTQIWQTLENQDFEVLLSSEVPPGCYTQTIDQATPSNSTDNTLFLRIPCLTKTLGPQLSKFSQQTEDGYPMAAAPHQSVKFKVHFGNTVAGKSISGGEITSVTVLTPSDGQAMVVNGGTSDPFDAVYTVTHGDGTTATYIASTTLDNGDSSPSSVSDMLNTWIGGGSFSLADATTTTINVDANITSCKMYAKQQIMCNEEREQMKAMPMGLPKRLKMTQNAFLGSISQTSVTMDLDHFSLYASHLLIASTMPIQTAELKLNSSSFSGALPGTLLYSATSESLATYCNKQIYQDTNSLNDQGHYRNYIFPLAATAYSGSSVPLNRFDSIRLTIKFSKPTADDSVSVTCVGETTALFKDGAASLAMY